MLQIGSLVDGKYRLLSEIGHGGMSVVYLAMNERANKTWAIKEVRKDGGTDSEVVQQGLVAETEMLKKLNHPHLPSIVDVIDTEDSFLIVMEYIEGKDLQSILNHSGPQDPELVREWAMQLCDTLGYLHSRKPPIIYRDMKPANVMLKPDGNVMVIDFGTAREHKLYSQGDTTWLGTRGYAAPEQFGGHGQTDARTDIYCLGATLYHLLTGKSPAETNYAILPLGQLNPSLAQSGWEEVVAKCCQPDPNDRYQNCAELMYALETLPQRGQLARRKRAAQLALFGVVVALAVISATGMIVFKSLKTSTREQSYDYFVQEGRDSAAAGDKTAAFDYFKQAVSMDRPKADAYLALMEVINKDDDVEHLDEEEDRAIKTIIEGTDGGIKKNIDYLAESDKQHYADLVFSIAQNYYFFGEGDIRKAVGAKWFEKVKDNEFLEDDQKKQLATVLYIIGDNQSAMQNSVLYAQDSPVSYKTIFHQLSAVINGGNLSEKLGGAQFAVAVYGEYAFLIDNHLNDFKNDGITKEEMEKALNDIEAGLNEIPSTREDLDRLIADTREECAHARSHVEDSFRVVGE
ncbi:MAG: serine/threonine protein kinase [Lachnospiraceae bacterium]|nr:serine/threonine protein kinase [Lachnospiraceae bacterium]